MECELTGRAFLARVAAAFFVSFAVTSLGSFGYGLISGDAELEQGRPQDILDEAISEGERFLKSNPDDVVSMLMLANLYRHAKNPDRQIDWARKALDRQDDLPEGWVLLGNGYRLTGRNKAAQWAFERALTLEADNVAALKGLKSIRGGAQ